ncbi:MAG: hypothetical protein AAGA96_18475 [Verrucomicrobiota bacterium]
MKKLGRRIRLTSDEGRRLFQDQLPLEGTIVRTYQGLQNPWHLLELDESFDYQIESKDSNGWVGFPVDQILIRSRWDGFDVGDNEPTSVFVMLTDDPQQFDTDSIDSDNFYFESWAMSERIPGT